MGLHDTPCGAAQRRSRPCRTSSSASSTRRASRPDASINADKLPPAAVECAATDPKGIVRAPWQERACVHAVPWVQPLRPEAHVRPSLPRELARKGCHVRSEVGVNTSHEPRRRPATPVPCSLQATSKTSGVALSGPYGSNGPDSRGPHTTGDDLRQNGLARWSSKKGDQ